MSRSQRISEQLGMPHGTAANKLRKIVLFDVLKRHNENKCFKCGEPIELADDLSLEHKEPWEGRAADLFWDLNNIAFSHVKCNTPHTFRISEWNIEKRKVGPAGTAWCAFHEKFEPIGNFWPHNARWNGLRPNCKTGRYGRNQIKV